MNRYLADHVRDRAVADVSLERGVSVKLIRGRRRFHYIAHARQEVIWRLRRLGYGFPEIGRSMGLDHTTCLFACRRHELRVARPSTAYPQPEKCVWTAPERADCRSATNSQSRAVLVHG